MTSPESISIHSKLQQVQQQWTPKVIAQVNENLVKIAKLQGDFIWHQHDDTDEMFLVVSGEPNLDFRDAASDPNVRPGHSERVKCWWCPRAFNIALTPRKSVT